MKVYGIWGAGGFAREVMPVAAACLATETRGPFSLVFVVDGQPASAEVDGHQVWSAERFLKAEGERYFNVAIAASDVRARIAGACAEGGIEPFSIRAPNSWITDRNHIGVGSIFCPFTTVTADARIGKFFHANIYSYVAHDCVIGDYVTFAPSVCCNGGVVIEDHAYLGTGAVLREASPGKPIVIGKGAVVGMGAVVTRSVAPYATVVGNPARPVERR